MTRTYIYNTLVGILDDILRDSGRLILEWQNDDLIIYGENGLLNSMELVRFILDVEDRFHEKDITLDLSYEKAMSINKSPFRTIDNFIDLIITQI